MKSIAPGPISSRTSTERCRQCGTCQRTGRTDTMWTIWHIYYTEHEQLFTVYNNLGAYTRSNQTCLITNSKEIGLHQIRKGSPSPCELLRIWKDDYVRFPSPIAKLNWAGSMRGVGDISTIAARLRNMRLCCGGGCCLKLSELWSKSLKIGLK